MIAPYYEHTTLGITLYHGDCRVVLPTLPRDSVDLLLTDPPYGVRWQSNNRQVLFARIAGDDSTEAGIEGVRLSIPAVKRGRHLYVFGRYDFSALPVSEPVELIWDKEIMNGGDLSVPWGRSHEYIQFMTLLLSPVAKAAGRGNLAARLRRGSVLRVQRIHGDAVQLHPTEKPVPLLQELIESSSCMGETVLDPFVGSGSLLEAAMREGRRAIGIELEERYCEIAARRCGRLAPLLAQLDMFDSALVG